MDQLFNEPIEVRIDNDEMFYRLHNRKITPFYENEIFIEKHLTSNVTMEAFRIVGWNTVKEEGKNGSRFFLNGDFQEQLTEWNRSRELLFLSFLYDKLNRLYQVETFASIQGRLKTTKVLFYLIHEKAVIIPPTYNAEELLNLLTVPDLKVYVCDEIWTGDEEWLTAIFLNKTSTLDKLIEEELNERKRSEDRAKKLIETIVPRKRDSDYLSLEDEKSCLALYHSFTEEQLRDSTRFFMDLRGDKVMKYLYGSLRTIMFLGEQIRPIEALIQAFCLVEDYKKRNEALIECDKKRDRNDKGWMSEFSYQIRFLEYKLLVKEVGIRYREAKKWMEEFHAIAKRNALPAPKKNPNKESLYYEATLKAVEELKKLWFVSEVILYGSVARGEESFQSDIDLAYKIGFDVSRLTQARRNTLHSIVLKQLRKVQDEYESKIEGFPLPKKNPYDKKGLFEVLAWDLQTKTVQKTIEKAGFFEESIILFKRDSFNFNHYDIQEKIAYKNLEFIIVPTQAHFTYISEVIDEDDDFLFVKHLKYECELIGEGKQFDQWFDFREVFVCIQMIDKEHYRYRFKGYPIIEINNKNEYEDFLKMDYDHRKIKMMQYRINRGLVHRFEEQNELDEEISNGGMRSLGVTRIENSKNS